MTHLHRLGAPTAALLVFAFTACGGRLSSTESTASSSSKGASPKSKGASATSKGATSKSETASRISSFGTEASSSRAAPVEAVALGYLHASSGGQWSRACSYLSEATRRFAERIAERAKQTKGVGTEVTGCAGVVREVTKALPAREREQLGKVDVHAVRVKGQRGYVIYADPGGAEYAMPAKREANQWRLSSLTATGLSS